MRLFQLLIASWAYVLLLLPGAFSAPELAFPVNSQVPPVAYASERYKFSFSASTFHSDESAVSYTLANAPAWLTLDSNGRVFEGTPAPGDVGAPRFQLRASDGTGETSSEVTLVVVQRAPIKLEMTILPYLEASGPISAPSTLLLKPLAPFSILFPTSIFSGTSHSTIYYAVSADSSPLPPWIQFDPTTLSFSGSSPPLVSPNADQQLYGISLIASDVPGFAEAIISFHIGVAYQTLAFSEARTSLEVTPGHNFKSPAFRESLKLDGNPVRATALTSVSADMPGWLHLDNEDIGFSGTVPNDFESATFITSARDSYGDTANMTVKLIAKATSTGEPEQTLNTTAIIGEEFSYTIPTSVIKDSGQVSARLADAPTWLTFSTNNLTLHGHVPIDVQPHDLILRLVAVVRGKDMLIQLSIDLMQLPKSSSTTGRPSASSSTPSPFPSPTEQTGNNSGTTEGRMKPRHIIAIVLTTVVVSLFVLLCICCLIWWPRRRAKGKGSEDTNEAATQQAPVAQDPDVRDSTDLPPIAESSRKTSNSRETPTQAPQVELPWAPDSLQRTRKKLSKRPKSQKRGSFDSSWSGLVTRPEMRSSPAQGTDGPFDWPPTVPPFLPVLPSYSAKRQSSATKASSSRPKDGKQQRGSKALSSITNRQVGLPKRLSGAGHGAGILTANNAPQRSSWQTTLGSIPLIESRHDTTTLEAFPDPPSEGKENQSPDSRANLTKPSLRLVEPSSETSDSFDIMRQKWHTERARDRLEGVARFSNAGSSHSPSLPLALASSAFFPSRTISPTIPENGTYGSRVRDPSWSKWSEVGLAARAESPLSARAAPRLGREVSAASSGQFDSALSSESQWEDENLIAEVNEAGERQWHTDTESAGRSPRLPFKPFSSPQEEVGNARQAGLPQKTRLIDKRKHVSVEEGDMPRSEKSRAGSFRFI
jgi:axial budding pattern protein 2